MNDDVAFKVNQVNMESVYSYLLARNGDFTPPLSKKLDISQFVEKIYKNANIYSAHARDIIGLAGCYANNYETLEAYITHISIHPVYYGSGIATELIEFCLNDIEAKGFRAVKLEVRKHNARAIHFYKKVGFDISDSESNPESYYMIKRLEGG